MAKRVVNFEAADGSLHATLKAANDHDFDLLSKEKIRSVLQVSLSTMRAASVVGEMLLSVDELLPILLAYKKRKPKNASPKRPNPSDVG